MNHPPPLIPQPFLQLCTKYEYFKRNNFTTTVQNVHEMINSELTRNAVQRLPVVEKPEFPDDFFGEIPLPPKRSPDPDPDSNDCEIPDDELPVKRRRKEKKPEKKEEEKVTRRVKPSKMEQASDSNCSMLTPDPDSDNSDIKDYEEEEEPEIRDDSQIPLEIMRMWICRFAELEIQKRAYFPRMSFNILEILSIRLAVPYETVTVRAPLRIVAIHVIISPRCILFNLQFADTYTLTSVQYWSDKEGCLFRCRDRVRLIHGIKYQHLAAKHFFTLVRDPRNNIETLRFSTKEFDPKTDPPEWPSGIFYRKIQKHLSRLGKQQISVGHVDLHIHQYMGNPKDGEKRIQSILKHLNPDEIKSIKLRVWDDSSLRELKGIKMEDKRIFIRNDWIPMELWRRAGVLDILDRHICVQDYSMIWAHAIVKFVLSEDDLPKFVESCPEYKMTAGKTYTFVLPDSFNIKYASRKCGMSPGRISKIMSGKVQVHFGTEAPKQVCFDAV
ncbi:hypothetical protein CAEBREN_20189 [Caenorhabditis brenneri]|uniref:DUF38 domain-containing protein n=1 Tax=Caenorhabditis brenneri TaxID=135651 RepID=G0NL68_CAEBE|nr:hypothetical protein CAEBREN_20189 [Caenorhabditis brenneri]